MSWDHGGGIRADSQGGGGHGVSHTVPECLHTSCQLAYRVRQNEAVRLVALPQTEERLDPGTMHCGRPGPHQAEQESSHTAGGAADDSEGWRVSQSCRFLHWPNQICVGDPREGKSTFLVRQCRVG